MTDIYRAIADPVRRKILLMTAQKEYTQKEIVSCFSISQPAIIKHIKILKEEDLIKERREGKFCYYKLNQAVFDVHFRKLQMELGNILDRKLTNLKDYLEEDDDQ
ncbi:metalloregulator ArsR/SmtB family transcription factor [Evansella halocellulosilytica]|uniref:metalloregulator ArsR/SmtB family transcription factor n=1 Tax=Evansella halocellulosilytica TaxID=2011013 RepID=UPI000BB8D53B|nr:metalloregulator ArsR/SmtB family transcription factor [Evansella halocellulosilytica]